MLNWVLPVERGQNETSWATLAREVGQPLRHVRVFLSAGTATEQRIRSRNGVPFTSAERLSPGARGEFPNYAGDVVATVVIDDLFDRDTFLAKVDTCQVDPQELARKNSYRKDLLPNLRWAEKAKARGIPEDLAKLGEVLMRESFQRYWSAPIQKECGWADEGEAMLRLALERSEQARKRWDWLLVTDGGRGQLDEHTGRWHDFSHSPSRDH